MNFLLAWMHWGLAALLYFQNAKFSQAAPAQGDGEKQQSEVISFLVVFERSACRTIETMVDIFQEYPDEVEYIFKPSCVPLMRCAGCCNDEALECVPTSTYNVTMEILRIKHFQGQHLSRMSFQQHRECECRERPKKEVKPRQENHCEPCSERRKHLFKQDPQTCKCSCKFTDSRCKSRQLELNERTCRCEKPRR
ncbi:vascular endothelial growth factor A, long form isoform X2 [Podarcis muralis]|uniref:Vascular endothelial growth factor A n=2 Tax=Podarcis TaxID=42163 RepID=A0A670I3J4_PODMU|nr:vascular endothelial growth factor A isoform X4 [Podarcis muralis]XP_053238851.1 vascular endothelial growth factor A isoform X4 [Podarcis raffonei]CAI5770743.1 vascular endothelial growth factor A isoform X3 [Podarcis lilfordi]